MLRALASASSTLGFVFAQNGVEVSDIGGSLSFESGTSVSLVAKFS